MSVLLPVYNATPFLLPALESIRDQTLRDFEVMAVDDGSTDSSLTVLRDFAASDSRFTVLSQPNRGVAAATNRALHAARHELCARMDADDLMLPSRLERQLWFMERHSSVAAATAYVRLIDQEGVAVAEAKPVIDVARGIARRDPACFVEMVNPATVMRKTAVLAVGAFSDHCRFGEDRECWGRLVTAGYELAVQPEFVLEQRIHGASLSANRMRQNEVFCRFIDANIVRRLNGQPELDYPSFLEERRNRPWFERFQRDLKERSMIQYKKATRDFSGKRWARFAVHAAGAIALDPNNATRMLKKKASSRRVSAI